MTKKIYLQTSKKYPGSLHFPLLICCIFSGHIFLRTSLDGCFWSSLDFSVRSKSYKFLEIIDHCKRSEYRVKCFFGSFQDCMTRLLWLHKLWKLTYFKDKSNCFSKKTRTCLNASKMKQAYFMATKKLIKTTSFVIWQTRIIIYSPIICRPDFWKISPKLRSDVLVSYKNNY